MNRLRMIRQSLLHYWRTNLGTLLGVAVATMVLVGALAVGDSVRFSLQKQAAERIGNIEFVLPAADRFVTTALAERLRDVTAADVAPVIQLRGTTSTASGSERVRDVQLLGIDESFSALGPRHDATQPPIPPGEVMLNEHLATRLDVEVGETIVLRVEQPSAMPRESVLGKTEDITAALRVKFSGIIPPQSLGNFSLHGSSTGSPNAFVSREWLESNFHEIDGANLILVGNSREPMTQDQIQESLRTNWALVDIGLSMREVEEWKKPIELRSSRIFIDQPIVDVVTVAIPEADGVLTYFVNTIAANDGETPYSMVTSFGNLRELEEDNDDVGRPLATINRWLADDLGVQVGESIELSYFLLDERNELVEEATTLAVSQIVGIEGPFADDTLMPDFPGITDAESSREWESDLPIDLGRIREKDEKYWDDYRGTPKVFFTPLSRAVEMWSNRFGPLTSIRVAADDESRLRRTVLDNVDPASIGLTFIDVRNQLQSTVTTDFGGLFIGLSFFLIAASLILTTLLFVFGVEQRASEIGLLLSVGFRPRQVRNQLVGEGLIIAIIGAIIGAIAGMLYTRAILLGLTTVWQGAVGGTFLEFHVSPTTVIGGAIGSVIAAVIAMWWALRKHVQKSPTMLLRSLADESPSQSPTSLTTSAGYSRIGAIICATLAIGCTVAGVLMQQNNVTFFFVSGSLLLIAGLLWSRWQLKRTAAAQSSTVFSRVTVSKRNTGRRLGRSLATVILLACGVFLIVTVAANRIGTSGDPSARGSGTGGFALFAESTLPMPRDLSTVSGQRALGFRDDELATAAIVPIRVVAGDDASCLNLAVPTSPRLFGIDSTQLAKLDAFTFAELGDTQDDPWLMLEQDLGPDVTPAIGDAASVRWTMHKSVGDDLEYIDSSGQPFRIRIVGTLKNSIMQGVLIIDSKHLQQRYPNTGGDRAFLIDVENASDIENVQATMNRQLSDVGFAARPTTERLAEFNEVQNTYLAIFQILGGLGLVLGTMGLGMVVLRNTLERRQEFAVMQAIGFRKRELGRFIRREHYQLLIMGLAIGTVAALVASLPSLINNISDDQSILQSMLITLLLLIAIVVIGLASVMIAAKLAMRGKLLSSLRSE